MHAFTIIDENTPQHLLDLQAQYGEELAAFAAARDRMQAARRALQRAQHEYDAAQTGTFKRRK